MCTLTTTKNIRKKKQKDEINTFLPWVILNMGYSLITALTLSAKSLQYWKGNKKETTPLILFPVMENVEEVGSLKLKIISNLFIYTSEMDWGAELVVFHLGSRCRLGRFNQSLKYLTKYTIYKTTHVSYLLSHCPQHLFSILKTKPTSSIMERNSLAGWWLGALSAWYC